MVIPRLDGTITTVPYLALHVLEFQHVIFSASGQTTYGYLLKREDHTTRRLVMTNRKQNKKKNRNVSDLSDTIFLDGSTAPHAFTARGRTHLGGSQMEMKSNQAISPPVTAHQSPVNQSQSTSHRSLFTGNTGTSHQSLVNQALVN